VDSPSTDTQAIEGVFIGVAIARIKWRYLMEQGHVHMIPGIPERLAPAREYLSCSPYTLTGRNDL